MPIADRRSPRNTNSLQHRPSTTMRRLVSHSTHVFRRSGKFVAPGWRASNSLSIFHFLTLGGLPLGPRSPKGEMTYWPPRSTILQNFSPIAQTLPKFFLLFGPWGANPWAEVHQKGKWPGGLRDLPSCKISSLYAKTRPRYRLPKFPADTQKKTNSNRYIRNMPICMCGKQTNSKRYIPNVPIGMWG